eukprot:7906712-Ditylum_brightwellii.AAC.1
MDICGSPRHHVFSSIHSVSPSAKDIMPASCILRVVVSWEDTTTPPPFMPQSSRDHGVIATFVAHQSWNIVI